MPAMHFCKGWWMTGRGDSALVHLRSEDGHEVVFQTDGPKHQYQCFLASWLSGPPVVPVDDTRDAACP